jgi:hypothetical protein
MIHSRKEYRNPMRDFLNNFADREGKKIVRSQLNEIVSLFRSSIKIMLDAKGDSVFRPHRTLNAAVFEAVVVGLTERLRQGSSAPEINLVRKAYDELLAQKDFMTVCESSTAARDSVETRHRLAVEAFSAT